MDIDKLIEKWRDEKSKAARDVRAERIYSDIIGDLEELKEHQKDKDTTFNTNEIEKDVAIRVLAEMVAEKPLS